MIQRLAMKCSGRDEFSVWCQCGSAAGVTQGGREGGGNDFVNDAICVFHLDPQLSPPCDLQCPHISDKV